MALTFVNADNSGGFADAASVTFTHTPASAHDLVEVRIGVVTADSPVTFTCTYGGVSMTQHFSTVSNPAFFNRTVVFYLKAPASGAKSVVITPSSNIWGGAACISWLGADQTTPLGTKVTQSGAGGTSDTIAFASTNGNFVVDVAGIHVASAVTLNQTTDYNVNTSPFPSTGQHAAGTGGTINMTISGSTFNGFEHSAYEVIAAAAAGISIPVVLNQFRQRRN